MASLNNISDTTLPTSANQPKPAQTERINLELDDSNPQAPKIKMRQQSWSEGVGWFTQKTIALTIEQAVSLMPDLEHTLVSAKLAQSQTHHQSPNPPAKTALPENTAKLIEFPMARTQQEKTEPAKNPVDSAEGKVVQFKPRKVR